MAEPPSLPGVESSFVATPRPRQRVQTCGPVDGIPVLLIHGNFAAATHWEELMLGLAGQGYRCIAPDLRGYGWTEAKAADATRGYADFAEDLAELMEALRVGTFHLVGWSMGGDIAIRYVIDYPGQALTLTLQAPGSPYGVGGTKDTSGTPCYDDFAGSGGGIANPEFVKRMAEGDRGGENPTSPRNVINAFFYKAPFRAAREEDFLTASLQQETGDRFYPGDFVASTHWPNVSPGVWGPLNASSPKYTARDAAAFVAASPKPPVLWIRGADDILVGDTSMVDPGMLGKLGVLPGWPGDDIFPPQPMIGQTRTVLNAYRDNGGTYREVLLDNCGHSPHIEHPDLWQEAFIPHTRLAQTGGWQVV